MNAMPEEKSSKYIPPMAILAGGMATRLWPKTKSRPKSMLEIAGQPFIAHQLELVRREGITEVVICAGFLGEQIRDFVQNGERWGIKVNYSFDGERLLGTGGALRKALLSLGDIFWVMYGDSYLDTHYLPILDYFLSTNKLGLMTVFQNNGRWDRCNVLFKNGQICKYDKRYPDPEMTHIDYGLSLLRKEALMEKSEGEVFNLADLYAELVKKKDMLGYEVEERFYEIGSMEGQVETRVYLEEKKHFV